MVRRRTVETDESTMLIEDTLDEPLYNDMPAAGSYRVDILINGELKTTVPFRIVDAPQNASGSNISDDSAASQQPLQSLPNDAGNAQDKADTTQFNTPPVEPTPPDRSANREPSVPSAARAISEEYEAKHIHHFGSCDGYIHITTDYLLFTSSKHQFPLKVRREDIKRIDHNGFVDRSDKKWHFAIGGMTAKEVEGMLQRWYNGPKTDRWFDQRGQKTANQ